MNPTAAHNALLIRAVASVRIASSPVDGGDAVELPHEASPVIKDLGNGLCVVYLVDEGNHFVYVQNQHLAQSGFNAGGLHECALSNLARISEGKAKVQQHGAVYGVFLDGMFEASLILLDHLWDETLAHLAPNGFVVALPSRDVLAFCDAGSAAGVRELQGVVERVFAEGGSHMLTRTLYQRRQRAWQPMA